MHIQEHPDGVVVKVKVQPRAARNRIAGIMGDVLKVTITSPPVDGEANKACLEFFAGLLKVSKNRIEIISGQTARTKLIKIYGITREDLEAKIGDY